MRFILLGSLVASLALAGCSSETPTPNQDNAPKAGTVEEGVNAGATEIEELPVEEGAPAPVEGETQVSEETQPTAED